MTTQDNRAEWFAKTAILRANNEGAWLCKFVHGRHVQARIEPNDLTLARLMAKGRKPAAATDIETARARKKAQR